MNSKMLILPVLFLTVVMFGCTTSPPANIDVVLENKTTSTPTISPAPKKVFETDPKLQVQANSLLILFDKMPMVSVYLTDEPIIKTGSETQKGVAYTMCATKETPAIYMKKVFYQKANQIQLVNILKHEMVHAWFCRQGIQASHDQRFRKKFKEVGGFGN
jgi:hypothetical protein